MLLGAPTAVSIVAHTIHYVLIVGGAIVVALLLLVSRPRPPGSRPSTSHELRVAQLRAAVGAGQLAEPVDSAVPGAPEHQPTAPRRALRTEAGSVLNCAAPVAMTSSAAAAAVHAAAGPHHFAKGVLLGAFFVVAALAQLIWAIVALAAPGARLWRVGAIGNAAIIALWTVTRTLGLPFGLLSGREEIGPWDLAATGWELVLVGACCAMLAAGVTRPIGPSMQLAAGWPRPATAWLLLSVLVLSVLTLTGAPS